jgi:hypothetical protein
MPQGPTVNQFLALLQKLQGYPSSLDSPQPNDVLQWDGTSFVSAPGGGGIPTTGTLQYNVDFAFDTASPMSLFALLAGDTLVRAVISITVPFAGQGQLNPTLQLGTVQNPSLLFGVTETNPKAIGQYEYGGVVDLTANHTLRLIIDSAGCTQGAGSVLFELVRP